MNVSFKNKLCFYVRDFRSYQVLSGYNGPGVSPDLVSLENREVRGKFVMNKVES